MAWLRLIPARRRGDCHPIRWRPARIWRIPRRTSGRRADSAQSFAAFDALTVEDIAVHRLVTAVFHLGKPLSAVHEEPLRSRVLAQQQQQAPA